MWFNWKKWLQRAKIGVNRKMQPIRRRPVTWCRPALQGLEDRLAPASFTVNTLLDTVDANPGDGLAADASGFTSLRAAIMEANASAGSDTINLPTGAYNLTIAGAGENAAATGDLDITSNLTIMGTDAATTIIDAHGIDRVIDIIGVNPVTISGVTIKNGDAGDDFTGGGGVHLTSGGKTAAYTVTLTDCIITGNTAVNGAGINNDDTENNSLVLVRATVSNNTASTDGAGIAHGPNGTGSLTLTDCIVSNNRAGRENGGILAAAGLPSNLTITGSTISGNTASGGGGGGVTWFGDTFALSNSTITGNTAGTDGGGIVTAGGNSITVTNCTISGNTAGGNGGGIANFGGNAPCVLTNVTINNNVADNDKNGSGNGGGVFNSGALTINDCTLRSSNASQGGGIFNDGVTAVTSLSNSTVTQNIANGNPPIAFSALGGGIANSDGTVTMSGCTVADNFVGQLSGRGAGIFQAGNLTIQNSIVGGNQGALFPDLAGPITNDLGHNLIGKTSGGSGFVASDLLNVDPLLAPIDDYGGSTQTIALLPGSPAIDAGDNTNAPAADQRGFARVVNGTIDIGAFESRGFTMTIAGGDNQTTLPNTSFAIPLSVAVTSPFGEPVQFGRVTFSAPGSGASATFPPGIRLLPASGLDSESAKANGITGRYTVSAAARGAPTLEFHLNNATPNIFTVTNTDDNGPGSLRQAILDADATANSGVPDQIQFAIPGAGVHTISPTSALPDITDAVVIDGGNNGVATDRVQISGGGVLSTGLSVPESAGGPTVEIRNLVINGFTNLEIRVIFGSGDVIQGNLLGLDPDGNLVPNSGDGINIVAASGATIGGASAAERNVIAGFGGNGITIDRSSATIHGNFIGLDPTGTGPRGSFGQGISVFNAAATIGGTSAGEGNVIVAGTGLLFSGNPAQGHSTGTVQGNFIGTDVTGTVALNQGKGAGIELDHARGVLINGGNVISGNGDGIDISSSGTTGATSDTNTIQGNFIGTAADGVTPLGNSGDGVGIFVSANNKVGGANSGEGNVIAFNGHVGVHIAAAGLGNTTGNAVEGNSIFANGGLGIDLAGGDEDHLTGVTRNDAGDGDGANEANNFQNFPILTSVVASGDTTVTGTLNSTPNTAFRIEFFASNTADPSGFGEGQTFLGFTDVTTDASGDVSFTASLPRSVSAAQVVTATATDPAGNTSEFSAALPVQAVSADLAVTQSDFGDSVTAGRAFTYQIFVTNNGPTLATGVTLIDTVPENLMIVSASPGFTQLGNTLAFLFGNLGPGAGAAAFVEVLPRVAGAITNVASVSANESDPNPANNTATEGITITADVATHLSLSAPSTATAGQPFTISVDALDQFENISTGYQGVVHFTSSDRSGPTLPADFAFTAADAGSHTFTNGVILRTIGSQTITATDTANNTITGSATVLVAPGGPATFQVTKTLDSGPGSLRQAILDANAHAGKDTITFHIGSGSQTIFVGDSGLGALPDITDPVTIDGTTQPGFFGRPLIELDGTKVGPGIVSGLTVIAGKSFVNGLVIDSFSGSGIVLHGVANVVGGSYLGTDLSGTVAKGNGVAGVEIVDGANNTVGKGAFAGSRNVISGNVGGRGVLIDSAVTEAFILGNFIGTDFTGKHSLPNNSGVEVNGKGVEIGETSVARRNLISGNNGEGILLLSPARFIEGNFIGTDVAGTHALGNGVGIDVRAAGATIGGTVLGARNIISGNINVGIEIDADSTFVLGNFIGTDVLGTHALGNQGSGIIVNGGSHNQIGGNTTAARNVISGNGSDGIRILTPFAGTMPTDNRVQGNIIGADITGAISLGHQQNGVAILAGQNTVGGSAAGTRNIISGNMASGVLIKGIFADNNTVQGNFIGVGLSGMKKLANNNGVELADLADGNAIGGTTAAARNIISGNTADGVFMHTGAGNNRVKGNLIGSNLTGAAPIPNQVGVFIDSTDNVIGGTAPGEANLISGNTTGVKIDEGLINLIQGNRIGVNLAGTAALPNVTGIEISDGFSNLIGGSTAAGNVISGNTGPGIVISGFSGGDNVVRGNLIGTDSSGKAAIANGEGILINGSGENTIGGAGAVDRNIISGNKGDGVHMKGGALENDVSGNFIGTDISGAVALANGTGSSGGSGVEIADGSRFNHIGDRAANVISGNHSSGVFISSANNNQVLGNLIGTDITGTIALSNGVNNFALIAGTGVSIVNANGNIIGGTAPGSRNVISGNVIDGVYISGGSQNQVLGNLIGTDISGALPLANGTVFFVVARGSGVEILGGSEGTIIGGPTSAERNIISGNAASGIHIGDSGTIGNVVQGNFIGTDISGTLALPNGSTNPTGVAIDTKASVNNIGGTTVGAGNVISGNTAGIGVHISGPDTAENVVEGNFIGTDFSGTRPLPNTRGVVLSARSSTIIGGSAAGAGNVISGNALDGILISGTSNGFQGVPPPIQVQGNMIGTDVTGSFALPNAGNGVRIDAGAAGTSASGNIIGGASSNAGNVISGNKAVGVLITGSGTKNNQVLGNRIGTDPSGTFAVPNGSAGVAVSGGASANIIGGSDTGAGNIISGNFLDGVSLNGTGTTGNKVLGNFIGTDITGTVALPNGPDSKFDGNGVVISSSGNTVGGTASGAGNVISGNPHDGVRFSTGATGNQVLGNYIGLDVSGTFAVGNENGVEFANGATGNTIGGAADGARNVISGNAVDGVLITGQATTNNQILGNFIGTDASGTVAVPNFNDGVRIENKAAANILGGSAKGAGNVISGNFQNGITINGLVAAPGPTFVGADNNHIVGNLIGTDDSGTLPLPNRVGITIISAIGTTVGGATNGAGNVISGNIEGGLLIKSPLAFKQLKTLVEGNYIGTDVTGTVAVPNSQFGVSLSDASTNTIGGTIQGARNIISGNAGRGVLISNSVFSLVQGNLIGTDVSGTGDLGNNDDGVAVDGGVLNIISSNTIAFNGDPGHSHPPSGVVVEFGTQCTISRNSIFCNEGLGIDLAEVANANNNQSAPQLTKAVRNATGTAVTVTGSLVSKPNKSFILEFFVSPAGDPEGAKFLVQKPVTTNAQGKVRFTFSITATFSVGQLITVTATDPTGNTSEFSSARAVT